MATHLPMSIRSASAAGPAYQWCRALARSHYENFPVASLLLPGRLRDPVAAIYAFARTADDIADTPGVAADSRLHKLNDMAIALDSIEQEGTPDTLMFQALADTIRRHRLPLKPFRDLLSAFRQDVSKTRYSDFAEVMDYCRRSANPVGELMLHLTGQLSEHRLSLSNAICSALQLINFLQDIEEDYRNNHRIYLPVDEMQRFAVCEDDIEQRRNSPRFHDLIQLQIERAAELLRSGSPLGRRITGRFGLELRAITLGGMRILEKLRNRDDLFDPPRLTAKDRRRIVWCALKQGIQG
jgi:squalene synthase HpnC